MADVFISYSRDDRGTADRVAKRLACYDISVWFDDRLEHASPFDTAIQNELGAARAVLVLWSPAAIASEWVRAEAAHARDRGVLLMATIHTCVPPPPFNVMQSADLRQWVGTDNYSEWLKLVGALGAKLSRPGLEPFALARSSGLLLPVRDWAKAYPDDPLADGIRQKMAASSAELQREEAALAEVMEQRRAEAERKWREDIEREARRRQRLPYDQYAAFRHVERQEQRKALIRRFVWLLIIAGLVAGAYMGWQNGRA